MATASLPKRRTAAGEESSIFRRLWARSGSTAPSKKARMDAAHAPAAGPSPMIASAAPRNTAGTRRELRAEFDAAATEPAGTPAPATEIVAATVPAAQQSPRSKTALMGILSPVFSLFQTSGYFNKTTTAGTQTAAATTTSSSFTGTAPASEDGEMSEEDVAEVVPQEPRSSCEMGSEDAGDAAGTTPSQRSNSNTNTEAVQDAAAQEAAEDAEADAYTCDDDDADLASPYRFIRRLAQLPRPRVGPTAIASKSSGAPRATLVLDLDETLVHCATEPLEGADMVFPVVWNGFEYQVFARKRPHLEAFLEQVSQLFEIVVFTASQQVYADKILDLIDPQHKYFKHRVFRDGCVCVEGNYLKDLTILGRDLATTVIIDNSPQAFGYQYDNGIPIETWYDAPDDTELIKMLPFLRHLSCATDVRPLLRARYKLYRRIERPEC